MVVKGSVWQIGVVVDKAQPVRVERIVFGLCVNRQLALGGLDPDKIGKETGVARIARRVGVILGEVGRGEHDARQNRQKRLLDLRFVKDRIAGE